MFPFIVLVGLMTCCFAERHVYPRILEERSTTGNLVVKLDDKMTLNLQKSTVLADKLLFVTSSKDLHVVETVDTSDIQKNIYHDTHYQSSVMARQKDGNVEIEGIINDNLRIRPLPEGQRSVQGQMLHKIFEVEPLEDRFLKSEPEMYRLRGKIDGANGNGSREDSKYAEARASSVGNFPVELHIISDIEHQRPHRKNEDLISYLAVMTNAANLRYLDMANPNISFILVGVTRAKDHRFAVDGNGDIDADQMWDGLKAYLRQGRVPGRPDVTYLMTGFDMYTYKKGRKSRAIRGLALIGVACTQLSHGEGEDTPLTYSGVNTLAHELAHTLGSPHDKTAECPWSEGYLMSYVDGGLKKYRLSRCSENQIRSYVRGLSYECIRILSSQNYLKDNRKFPGHTVRLQYFCNKLARKTAKSRKVEVKRDTECKVLCCYQETGYKSCYKYPMLDGMKCDRGKTCKRGVCGKHQW